MERCNECIKCTVEQCRHHHNTKNYCTLESIQVGTHEMNGRSGCFVQTRYPLFLLHCGGILSYNGKETGGRSMKIYFVRHGETDMNARNMFYGWYDADINEN